MSLLDRLFGGRKKNQAQQMMDALKAARLGIMKRVYETLPPQLRISDEELTQLIRAIAEQIDYATASSKFIGDDKQMLRKLEAIVTDLRLIGADEAASELISAVKMRPNYLALVESIIR